MYVYYFVVVGGDFVIFDEKLDVLFEWKCVLFYDMLNGVGDVILFDFVDIEVLGGGLLFGEDFFNFVDVGFLGLDVFEFFCVLLWSK